MNFIKVLFVTLALLAGQPAFSITGTSPGYENHVKETVVDLAQKIRDRQIDVVISQVQNLRTGKTEYLTQKNVLCDMLSRIERYKIVLSSVGTTEKEIVQFRTKKFLYQARYIYDRIAATSNSHDMDRAVEMVNNLSGTCHDEK